MSTDSDLFCIPISEGYFVYAPLRNLGMKMTQEQFDDEGVKRSLLEENNFFSEVTKEVSFKDPQKTFSLSDAADFTLGLTSKCNLRCVYCYADGGDFHNDLEPEIFDSIVEVIREASKKHRRVSVTFMGDGDSFMVQERFFASCQIIKDISQDIQIYVLTNGTMLTQANVQKMKDMGIHAQISYDPLGDSRPFPSGASSLAAAAKGFALLDEHEVSYTIRSTIMGNMVKSMPDMVDSLGQIAKTTKSVMFEPVGSCKRTEGGIDAVEFFNSFKEARERAKKYSFKLITSGYKRSLEIQSAFCGLTNPNVTFTPGGLLTSCARATRLDQNPYAEKYVYGKFNAETKKFDLDQEVIANLRRNAVVTAYPGCQDCPAKWHCSGGCSIMRDADDTNCDLNYSFFVEGLLLNYDKKKFANQRKPSMSVYKLSTPTSPVADRFDVRYNAVPVGNFSKTGSEMIFN